MVFIAIDSKGIPSFALTDDEKKKLKWALIIGGMIVAVAGTAYLIRKAPPHNFL